MNKRTINLSDADYLKMIQDESKRTINPVYDFSKTLEFVKYCRDKGSITFNEKEYLITDTFEFEDLFKRFPKMKFDKKEILSCYENNENLIIYLEKVNLQTTRENLLDDLLDDVNTTI